VTIVPQAIEVSETTDATPKSHKRKKKEKDPNAPSRPVSAYLLHCADRRARMTAEELEEFKGTALIQFLARTWRELPESERVKFHELAAAKLAKYHENVAEYQANLENYVEPQPSNAEVVPGQSNGPQLPSKKKRATSKKMVDKLVTEVETSAPVLSGVLADQLASVIQETPTLQEIEVPAEFPAPEIKKSKKKAGK